MNESGETFNQHFFQLVLSLQTGAMQQMGKIASPLTGKVERNLDVAKSSIDMLGMLKEKTEGNLSDDEKRLLDHVLYELRLNYVDELKKGDSQPTDKKADGAATAEAESAPPGEPSRASKDQSKSE